MGEAGVTSRGEPITDVAVETGATYVIEQDGEQFTVSALSDPYTTAAEFYDGTTTPGLGATDTSNLFLYEGSSGDTSLGVVHDSPATAGATAFGDDFDYGNGSDDESNGDGN